MTEQDTPETDAAAESICDRGMTEWIPADLGRKLERERDALRAAAEGLAAVIAKGQFGLLGERERDAALAKYKALRRFEHGKGGPS